MTPAALRAYRKRLRAEGVCTRCHREQAGEGRGICPTCSGSMNAARQAKRDTGTVCHDCLRPCSAPYCAACLPKKRRREHSRVRLAIETQRCTKCLRPLPEPGWSRCARCAELDSYGKKLRRAVNRWRS